MKQICIFVMLMTCLLAALPDPAIPQAASTINFGPVTTALSDKGDYGMEINVWVKRHQVNVAADTVEFMTVFSQVKFSIVEDADPITPNDLTIACFGPPETETGFELDEWTNINIRSLWGDDAITSFVKIGLWKGKTNYDLVPTLEKKFEPVSQYPADNTILMQQGTADLGVYWSELRVKKIENSDDLDQPWLFYYKYYSTFAAPLYAHAQVLDGDVYPDTTVDTPTAMPQSISLTVIDTATDIIYCDKGQVVQNNAYGCHDCGTDCDYCTTQSFPADLSQDWTSACRICTPDTTGCTAEHVCPDDHYRDAGICHVCPNGCSACTSATVCTACDTNNAAGLSLITEGEETLCKCESGFFGAADPADSTKVVCTACDAGQGCETCENAANECLSCADGFYWQPDDNGVPPAADARCLTTCSTPVGFYPDTTTNECKQCSEKCEECDDNLVCTKCESPWFLYDPDNDVEDPGEEQVICRETCEETTDPVYQLETNPDPLKPWCIACKRGCKSCKTLEYYDTTATAGGLKEYDNCDSCLAGFYQKIELDGNGDPADPVVYFHICETSCPDGQYGDPSTAQCKMCKDECTLCQAENSCQACTQTGNPTDAGAYYWTRDYDCVEECSGGLYEDEGDVALSIDRFCRDCPNACSECSDANTCTACKTINGLQYSLKNHATLTLGTTKVECVSDCGVGFYSDGTNCQKCSTAMTDCTICSSATVCEQCDTGKVVQPGNPNTCEDDCSSGYFIANSGLCEQCASGCAQCNSEFDCIECTSGSELVKNGECVDPSTACNEASGYYEPDSGNFCLQCDSKCKTCDKDECKTCQNGYEIVGSICDESCPDGTKDDGEECDDNNSIENDGCTNCMIDPGFICRPETGDDFDTCYCSTDPIHQRWINNWKTIEVTFGKNVLYDSNAGAQSLEASTFCTQIIDTDHTDYASGYWDDAECYLFSSDQGSKLLIDVDFESQIACDKISITLHLKNIIVSDCTSTVNNSNFTPEHMFLDFPIMNLPIETPDVIFKVSDYSVGKCANELLVDILESKGFTRRKTTITWGASKSGATGANDIGTYVESLNPDSDSMSIRLPQSKIEEMEGSEVVFSVTAENCFGNSFTNTTTVEFSTSKKIEVLGIPEAVTVDSSRLNEFYPRVRIPKCDGDSNPDYSGVTWTCKLYESNAVTKVADLTNCEIPADMMTYPAQYKLKVSVDDTNSNMDNTVWSVISIEKPKIKLGIKGSDRDIDTRVDNILEAVVVPVHQESKLLYKWKCFDKLFQSNCFGTNYQYLNLPNSREVTIAKSLLFPDREYEITVIATEMSGASIYKAKTLLMAKNTDTIPVKIDSAANHNLFINVNFDVSFSAKVTNSTSFDTFGDGFLWTVKDSQGQPLDNSNFNIYGNHLTIPAGELLPQRSYIVQVDVTQGSYTGFNRYEYSTHTDTEWDFRVEPSSGEAFVTDFQLYASTQLLKNDLTTFVFGYYLDGQRIYLGREQRQSRMVTPLPAGDLSMSKLKCFVDVISSTKNVLTEVFEVVVSDPGTAMTPSDLDTWIEEQRFDSSFATRQLLARLNVVYPDSQEVVIDKLLMGLEAESNFIDNQVASIAIEALDYVSRNLLFNPTGSLISRAMDIFTKLLVDEVDSHAPTRRRLQTNQQYVRAFVRQQCDLLFNFVDTLLITPLTQLAINDQQDVRNNLEIGTINVARGCLYNESPSQIPYKVNKNEMLIQIMKFDKNSFTNSANHTVSVDSVSSGTSFSLNLNNLGPWYDNSIDAVQLVAITQSKDQSMFQFGFDSGSNFLVTDIYRIELYKTTPSKTDPGQFMYSEKLVVADLDLEQTGVMYEIPIIQSQRDVNMTYGCGYIKRDVSTFKQEGCMTYFLHPTNATVTCVCNHMTSYGVEQYVAPEIIEITRERPIPEIPRAVGPLASALCLFFALGFFVLQFVFIQIGKCKDRRSIKGKLNHGNSKLYVGLYLDNEHMPTSMDDNQIDISHRKDVDQFDAIQGIGVEEASEVVNPAAKKKKTKKGKKGKKKKAAVQQQQEFADLEAEYLEGGAYEDEEQLNFEGGSDEEGGIFDMDRAKTKRKAKAEETKAFQQDNVSKAGSQGGNKSRKGGSRGTQWNNNNVSDEEDADDVAEPLPKSGTRNKSKRGVGSDDEGAVAAPLEKQNTKKSVKSIKKKATDSGGLSRNKSDVYGDSGSNEQIINNQNQAKATNAKFFLHSVKYGHRCLNPFTYYSPILSRARRFFVLFLSMQSLIFFTGIFHTAAGDMLEQHGLDEGTSVGIGLAAAILSKFIIFLGHWLFKTPTQGLTESDKKTNLIRLSIAVAVGIIFLLVFLVLTLTFAQSFSEPVMMYWELAFMWSCIWDFIFIELFIIAFNVIILKKVGKSPSSCGSKRNFWINVTQEGIRKTVR